MKKIKYFIVFFGILVTATLFGCNNKKLESATITRDDLRTGGTLSFVYDKKQRVVYVGGEDEVVLFSAEDEVKGVDKGCRVGIKVFAPNENLDLTTATLEMNGVNYSSDDFLESVNGQPQRFFNLYPLFSKEKKAVKFAIVWQDGTEKQEYKIEIIKGTRFMNEDGTFE